MMNGNRTSCFTLMSNKINEKFTTEIINEFFHKLKFCSFNIVNQILLSL